MLDPNKTGGSSPPKLSTGYHEAAHAIIWAWAGIKISICEVKTEISSKIFRHGHTDPVQPILENQIEACKIGLAAGYCSQTKAGFLELMDDGTVSIGDGSDMIVFRSLCYRRNEPFTGTLYRQYQEKALKELQDPHVWAAIEELALSLIDRPATDKLVREIVNKHKAKM